ncbi:MAG: antirestriction protein ArdA [Eubacteriales bacterium]|nr:antirestriction protein ArdA [Eubacteriales bacterium]
MSEKKPLEVLIINSRQDDRQEWLALPTDADKVRALFDRLGIEPIPFSQGPKADYYVSMADNLPFPELDAVIGKPNTIDGLNWLAARLDALDETELATVRAAMAVGNYYRLQDVIALTYNTEFYVLVPHVHNEADLGRYYLNDSGMVQMPEEWKAGIDPAQFGAHIMGQEKGRFTPQGYLVPSGDEWKEVGRANIPEEYKAEFGKPTPAKEKQSVRDALKHTGQPGKDAPAKPRTKHHGPEL